MSFAIKPGADIRGLDLSMRPVLVNVAKVYAKYNRDCVVTSGLDGVHSAGSLHYYGLAVDFRTSNLPTERIAVVVEEVKDLLGPDYFVLFEGDHLHVDYRKAIR